MRGSVLDLVIMCVMLMSGIIAVILSAHILGAFDTAWTWGGEAQTIIDAGTSAMTIFDYMIIFYIIGLGAFSIVSAYFVKSHPVFFVFSIILIGITVMFSAQVTNVLWEFLNVSTLSTTVNDFPLVVTLVQNLPLVIMLIGITIAIVTYAFGDDMGGRV